MEDCTYIVSPIVGRDHTKPYTETGNDNKNSSCYVLLDTGWYYEFKLQTQPHSGCDNLFENVDIIFSLDSFLLFSLLLFSLTRVFLYMTCLQRIWKYISKLCRLLFCPECKWLGKILIDKSDCFYINFTGLSLKLKYIFMNNIRQVIRFRMNT